MTDEKDKNKDEVKEDTPKEEKPVDITKESGEAGAQNVEPGGVREPTNVWTWGILVIVVVAFLAWLAYQQRTEPQTEQTTPTSSVEAEATPELTETPTPDIETLEVVDVVVEETEDAPTE